MTEPQVWTVMGVFFAALFGMLGVFSGVFTQVIRAEIGKVSVQVENLDRRIDRVETRLDRIDTRLDAIDRVVRSIARRASPE